MDWCQINGILVPIHMELTWLSISLAFPGYNFTHSRDEYMSFTLNVANDDPEC